jgi:hypothetical protein
MNRIVRAMALGLLLTVGLGLMQRHGYHADDPVSSKWYTQTIASLPMMIDGTAHQPFVRRQFVPLVIRSIDHVTPISWAAAADSELTSVRLLQPILFVSGPLGGWYSALCLLVWFCAFAIFAYVLEFEARHYGSELAPLGVVPRALRHWLPIVFSLIACGGVLPLLHNNYIYDPPTLAFSTLALFALRRERLWGLAVVTALFSCNRETAFIVPGMAFFYWIHRHRVQRAFFHATVLSVIYFAVAGILAYSYRENSGELAQNNVNYLVHMYLHEKLRYVIAASMALGAYVIAVFHCWKLLPPALKSVQWFIFPWIVMHVLWGWPMEWRVFLEIYPGMLLTVFALSSVARRRITSAAERPLQADIQPGLA